MKFGTGVDHQSVNSNIEKDLHKINVMDNDVFILRPLSFFSKNTQNEKHEKHK